MDVPTSDHVFPKSWYPDSTPPNLEKWQIPSCRKCNEDYGRLEEDLLYRMALCLDDKSWASLGLGAKVVNALNPARGRNERDTKRRAGRAMKLMRELHVPKGDRPIVCATNSPGAEAISIRLTDLERVGVKIMRGLVYMHLGAVIGPECDVFCSAMPRPEPSFDAIACAHGTIHEAGPGIQVAWAKTAQNPLYGMFLIVLFGRYSLRGFVVPRGSMSPG